VVIEPLEDKIEDALRAAKVVNVRAIPIMTNAIIAVVIEILLFPMFIPAQKLCIVNLNKSYCVPGLTVHLNNTATNPTIHSANSIIIKFLSKLKKKMIEFSPCYLKGCF
jgi:hypothetical protein